MKIAELRLRTSEKIKTCRFLWLYCCLALSTLLFVTVSALAVYKTKYQPHVTAKPSAKTELDKNVIQQLPEHVCPEAYDGNFYIYQGKQVGVDPPQSEWIHKNCPDIPGHAFSQAGKEYIVKSQLIDGPQPNGTIFNDSVFNSLTVSFTNPDIVYLGTDGNGVFKSLDGGKIWKWLRQGFLVGESCDPTQATYGKVYDIAIDPKNENNVYAALSCGPEVPLKSIGGLYKSTDAGKTWQQKITDLPNASVNAVAIDPNNPKIIYIGTNGEKMAAKRPGGNPDEEKFVAGGIFKSVDSGEHWQTLPIPEKGKQNRFDLLIIRNGIIFTSGLKYADQKQQVPDQANSLGLIKSNDGGQTWRMINPSSAFIENFDVTNDGQTIYTAQNKGSGYKSIDGGSTWQQININKPITIGQNGKTIFWGNLYKSNDSLKSSIKILSPEENTQISVVTISPSNSNIVYAATPGYIVYKSTDGGNSFVKMVNLREKINNIINTEYIKRSDIDL